MTALNNESAAPVCPRCRSAATAQVAQSPVRGRWVMNSCRTCWYAWRSTEGQDAVDPAFYPEAFRLDAADFAAVPSEV